MNVDARHHEPEPEVPEGERDELVITDDDDRSTLPVLGERLLEADAADLLDQLRDVDGVVEAAGDA